MLEEHERSYYEIQLDHKQLILIFFTAVGILVAMFLLGMTVGQGKGFGPLKSVAPSQVVKEKLSMQADPKPGEKAGETEPGMQGNRDRKPPQKSSQATRRQPDTRDGGQALAVSQSRSHSSPSKAKQTGRAANDPGTTRIDPSSFALSPESGYSVQVLTIKDQTRASEIRQDLKRKGYPAYVDVRESEASIPYYRVRIGKFLRQQDTLLVKEKLRQEEGYRDMIVVR